jgi:hypothetical protein
VDRPYCLGEPVGRLIVRTILGGMLCGEIFTGHLQLKTNFLGIS